MSSVKVSTSFESEPDTNAGWYPGQSGQPNHNPKTTDETVVGENPPDQTYSRDIWTITIYYIILMIGIVLFLMDLWMEKYLLVNYLFGATPQDESMRQGLEILGFAAAGGAVGAILYNLRQLIFHYAKKQDYSPVWFFKYLTGPLEGILLTLAVFSLLRGGVAAIGGSVTFESDTAAFAAFGLGALVGHGVRNVIGWLGTVTETMFPSQRVESGKGENTKNVTPSETLPQGG